MRRERLTVEKFGWCRLHRCSRVPSCTLICRREVAPVANEDIARTAVAVLMAPGRHDGKTYRPTGPQLLSAADAFFSTRAACAQGRARVTQKRRVTCWPPARLQLERR